jgi:hypothetical protein
VQLSGKKGKGGIDWYKYQEVVLKKLRLPFAYALKLKKLELEVKIIEDRALIYKSYY